MHIIQKVPIYYNLYCDTIKMKYIVKLKWIYQLLTISHLIFFFQI